MTEGQNRRQLEKLTDLESAFLRDWLLAKQDLVQWALSDFCKIRPAEIVLTLKPKLVCTSRRREHWILDLQAAKLRMRDALLTALREDHSAEVPREDGAFALICAALQGIAAATMKGSPVMVIQNLISKTYSNRPGFTPEEFGLPATVRQAIFQETAINLWRFYQDALEEGEQKGKRKRRSKSKKALMRTPRSAQEAFNIWAAKWRMWSEAANAVIPSGRHKGKTFSQAGKGNIRWLKERVLEPDILEKTIKSVKVLLNRKGHSQPDIQEAMRTLHPWRRNRRRDSPPKSQRAPRASWAVQQSTETRGKRITLGSIKNRGELKRLYDELTEQQLLTDRMSRLRTLIEVFLGPSPPRFPQTLAPLSAEERERAEWEHFRCLRAFTTPIHSEDDDDLTKTNGEIAQEMEFWEQQMMIDLLQAESPLFERRLKLLRFGRSMRPTEYGAAGLLFDVRTGQYVVAIYIPGAQQAQNDGFLNFAAFPYAQFWPAAKVPIVLFPLAYGKEYHDEQYIRQGIERAQLAQQQLAADPSCAGTPIEKCLPEETPFGPIGLSTSRDEQGRVEIYAHIPIHVPAPKDILTPTTVLGLHEEDNGRYAFAVVALAPQPCEDGRQIQPGDLVAYGDIVLPSWADPLQAKGLQPKAKRTPPDKLPPDNYVHEVAAAVVRIAERHNAYIGIEDTLWKKAEVSALREQNRETQSRPSARIAQIIHYTAILGGLLEPRDVSNVSPVNDCGQCGSRLKKKVRRNQQKPLARCPSCSKQLVLWEDGTGKWKYCQTCTSTWPSHETWFTCERCKTHLPKRFNLALVTAQRTIEQLLTYHDRLVKRRVPS